MSLSESTDETTIRRDLIVDGLCVQFEESLRRNVELPLEHYLNLAPEEIRPELEIELRRVLQDHQRRPINPSNATRIGPYTLVEKLGEGGMGEVWSVTQEQPVRRSAALKLIKPGHDSELLLARFEQERQTLARLEHPNIARILDGGVSEDHRPYFVMELVEGLPLQKYCDQQRLTVSQRLALFLSICHAVQHAHNKGVIHRDLKPSNILIAVIDGAPVVKIIDFGLARMIERNPLEDSVTQYGTILGTLDYMAPEQAGLGTEDVDTRADIYSLGVILYELLTGLRPFDPQRFQQISLEQIIRIIREEDPPRPSNRLSSADQLPQLAAARQTEPRSLSHQMNGDLDCIVMKCLEKDRQRRYDTASGLARDVERFLAHEPIEARPPSVSYKVRKFVRRNRVTVLASVSVLLMLVVAIVGTTWGMYAARRSEAKAVALKVEADDARAETQAKFEIMKRGNDVILNMIEGVNVRDVKAGAEPVEAVIARNMIQAGKLIDEGSVGNRETAMILQHRIARILQNLGFHEEAIPILQRTIEYRTSVHGADDRNALEAAGTMAQCYRSLGQYDRAIPILVRSIESYKQSSGEDHPDTLRAMAVLANCMNQAGKYADAIELGERIVTLHKDPDGKSLSSLVARSTLAESYYLNGKNDRAIELEQANLNFKRKLLQPDHPEIVTSRSNLATFLSKKGRFEDSVREREELYQEIKARLGSIHFDTLSAWQNLATAYFEAGQFSKAVPIFDEVVQQRRQRSGIDPPDSIQALNGLTQCHLQLNHASQAVESGREAVRVARNHYGVKHIQTLTAEGHLGDALQKNGNHTEAIQLYESSILKTDTAYGNDHPLILACRNNLAACYMNSNRPEKALPIFETVDATLTAKQGPNDPSVLVVRINKADCLNRLGRFDDAKSLFERSINQLEAMHGKQHTTVMNCRQSYAKGLNKCRKFAESKPILIDLLATQKAVLEKTDLGLLGTMDLLAAAHNDFKEYAAESNLLKDAVAIAEVRHGTKDLRTIELQSRLAYSYFHSGRSSQAASAMQSALASARAAYGNDHALVFNYQFILAGFLIQGGKWGQAIPVAQDALHYAQFKFGSNHDQVIGCLRLLIKAHAGNKDYAQELVGLEEIHRIYKARHPEGHELVFVAQTGVGECLIKQRQPALAEKALKESLAGFERQSPDHWQRYWTITLLGGCQMAQEKYEDAVANLLEGYNGMKARNSRIPEASRTSLSTGVKLLISSYKKLQRPEDVARWEKELENLTKK